MGQFVRVRPTVTAVRWDGLPSTLPSIQGMSRVPIVLRDDGTLVVPTEGGDKVAVVGDWVVQGNGELTFLLDADTFATDYEAE